MVCYFKRICGINQAEDRVTWPDLLHRHTIALVSFRERSVISARLRIRAQPRNPCRARNSASAWTCRLLSVLNLVTDSACRRSLRMDLQELILQSLTSLSAGREGSENEKTQGNTSMFFGVFVRWTCWATMKENLERFGNRQIIYSAGR